uniref:Uncharacterized protein n=1 Tax=Arundo donax TaxID=35708 RepID=A0A0A9GWL5_ARUDO
MISFNLHNNFFVTIMIRYVHFTSRQCYDTLRHSFRTIYVYQM